MRRFLPVLLLSAASALCAVRVVVPENAHPAARSAAQILERKASAAGSGEIVLTVGASPRIKHDGYEIVFTPGRATIKASRPRALLFAAGDYELWKDRKLGSFVRDPSFAIRTSQFERNVPIAENVARLGVNILIGPTGRGQMGERLEQELPALTAPNLYHVMLHALIFLVSAT